MEVINSINAVFMDYMNVFLKEVINEKKAGGDNWYEDYFLDETRFDPTEIAIHAGLNKKTITNVYGTAAKDTMISASNDNISYLKEVITAVSEEIDDFDFNMILNDEIGQDYKLSLIESYLIINTLTTKKAAIRGGAWSSIGKKVEKTLIDKLCEIAGVPLDNIW